ncbi:type-F conjugative transfer system pilin assembly protein TrbC [Candidatus Odyssella thessalonicensis]|uniref:type-F conjugative transfer system pilin assembly protein TrbC n=1 Tax=Candidatus Odyssella thessalonicensis TaxID=84647 RepID=UPI000225A9D5|nr:type-F conjugative transfer system pilin assembly protein TrbC [Candidatus Odyssella thessalonicensis]
MKMITLLPFLSLVSAEQSAQAIIEDADKIAEAQAASVQAFLDEQVAEAASAPSGLPRKKSSEKQPFKVVEPHKIETTQACQSKISSLEKPQSKNPSQGQLLIFASSSLPRASLQALSGEAKRINAKLIFRGLINNSFKDTQLFFSQLEITGEIDPPQFEAYQVTTVPTFILVDAAGKKVDRLQGNVSLSEALAQFKDHGELKNLARQMLKKLRSSWS